MPHFLLEGEGHKLRGLDGRLGRACDVNDVSVYGDVYFGGGVRTREEVGEVCSFTWKVVSYPSDVRRWSAVDMRLGRGQRPEMGGGREPAETRELMYAAK